MKDAFDLVVVVVFLAAIPVIIGLAACETSDSSQEPLYGPCSRSDDCGWGLTCIASDYGGDEGYCTYICSRPVDTDISAGSCVFTHVCGSGCCMVNYTASGEARGYCVPYP